MLPKALGPQIMSDIIHLHQNVTIIAIFQLQPSGQTKIEEARTYISNPYHPYWIILYALETEVAKTPTYADL